MAISYAQYSTASTLAVGMTLYSNSTLTTPVAAGYYSNGTVCYATNASGVITSIADCGVETTTTTTQAATTTTTIFPGSERRAIFLSRMPSPKEGTATSNISNFTAPNISAAALLADDSDLEIWNINAQSTALSRTSLRYEVSFNGVSVTPDYTFTDGLGNQALRSIKDIYQFYEKLIANTDLKDRNPTLRLHRLNVNLGLAAPIETYFGLTLDIDYVASDTIELLDLTGYVYNTLTTPYTISKPSPLSDYSNSSMYTYQGSYGTVAPTSDSASWYVGGLVPGSTTDSVAELNIPIPSSW